MSLGFGWANRLKKDVLGYFFRAATPPTNFYVALCTADTTPTPDTATLGDLTEIAAGNGYTSGGLQLDRNTTDWPALVQDNANDAAAITLKDIAWTASGGSIPASGNGARYAVLTDDNATVANRVIYHFWDLGAATVVPDGKVLTIADAGLRLTELA